VVSKLLTLSLVLTVLVAVGCRSKKKATSPAEEPTPQQSTSQVSEQPAEKSEAPVEAEKSEVQQAPQKPKTPAASSQQALLDVRCPDCGGEMKISDDKKTVTCAKCGKQMDVKTYSQVRMQKLMEKLQQMKQGQQQ